MSASSDIVINVDHSNDQHQQDTVDARPVAVFQPITVSNTAALASPLSHGPLMTGRRQSQQGSPPSYTEANDPNAAPPSYDSLFGRVREVRKSSNGFVDFIKNLFFYLLGKIGLLVMIMVMIILPICMLVIGSLYFYDCPAERNIPIYLIVGGAFGLLKQMLSLKLRSRRSRQDEMEVTDSSFVASLQSLINSFLLCWFITGCYWVYSAYEPDFKDPSADNYCDHLLFTFAFWLLTSTFIFFGTVVLLLCCISSTALLLAKD